jgi:sulfite reductase beta subunit-like hemoprotein
MTIDYQKLRLYGVYQQDKDENLMLRVKIPAGFLDSEQALEISAISREFSNGMLHLTSRGSIEFHWLKHNQLDDIFARLAGVGLTTRGACGGAVRGISCSTSISPKFHVIQGVAQKLNKHFAGNPDFEGLPKKFKVSVDAGYQEARHLIQDLGLVLVNTTNKQTFFDIWCAGGLGREPQPGFLLEQAVPENRIIHLIESVVQVYRENTPPPKRLKFLLNAIGEEEFRRLLDSEMAQRPYVEQANPGSAQLLAPQGTFLEAPVFAGELKADLLHRLATIASKHAGGYLATTANQNIALLAESDKEEDILRKAFDQNNIILSSEGITSKFRVCPGNHECRMGLSATREVSKQITTMISESAKGKIWAISGCRNSCSQPQLADYGIVTSKLDTDETGCKLPRFDLYRRDDDKFGKCIAEGLSNTTLYELIRTLE